MGIGFDNVSVSTLSEFACLVGLVLFVEGQTHEESGFEKATTI